MTVSGLGYLALNVSDMDAWLELVTDVFGMEVTHRPDGPAVDLRIDEYSLRFTLYPADEDSVAAVGWETSSKEDLMSLVARLTEYGVPVTEANDTEKSERGVRLLYRFIDPASEQPTELFFAPLSAMHPFRPSRGISGYKTGELGLGHVVYVVKDYQKSQAFYEEVMGFRISDYIAWDDKDAAFYHCSPRHHSLAIMKPFGPFQGGEFNHVMLEANNDDDVGYAYDIARDKGIPLVMEMGKHTNDHTRSFYMATPSGFAMEYGCNSRLIRNEWEVRSYDSPMLWGHRSPEVG